MNTLLSKLRNDAFMSRAHELAMMLELLPMLPEVEMQLNSALNLLPPVRISLDVNVCAITRGMRPSAVVSYRATIRGLSNWRDLAPFLEAQTGIDEWRSYDDLDPDATVRHYYRTAAARTEPSDAALALAEGTKSWVVSIEVVAYLKEHN